MHLSSQRVHERPLRHAAVQDSAKRNLQRDQHADAVRRERDLQRRHLQLRGHGQGLSVWLRERRLQSRSVRGGLVQYAAGRRV